MFSEKSCGPYRVLDNGTNSLTIKVTLNPGHKMNYHSHEKRDEVGTVIQEKDWTFIDDEKVPVGIGDVINMIDGCKHTVITGDNGLRLIEFGKEITEEDKKIFTTGYDLKSKKGKRHV